MSTRNRGSSSYNAEEAEELMDGQTYHSIEDGEEAPIPPLTCRLVFLPVALAVSGGLIFGYNTAIAAGTQDMVLKNEYFPNDRDNNSKMEVLAGVFVSSILFGSMIGALAGGVIADLLGRKWVVIMCSIVCVIGVGLCTGSMAFWMLLLARVILGVSVGVTSSIVPLYTSEVSPPNIRGGVGTMFQVSVCLGIVLAYIVSYSFCPDNVDKCYARGKNVWRWQFLIGAVPGIMMGLLTFFLPESPTWLAARRKKRDMQGVVGGGEKTSVFEIFAPKHARKLFLGVILAVGQQLTGINAIIFYAPKILQEKGVGPYTVGIGAWNLLTVLVSLCLVEYLGRRPLMVGTLGIMTVSNAFMALGSGLLPHNFEIYVTIIHLLVFVGAFEVGPGPLFFVIVGEIFPQSVRGTAVSLMTLTNWTCNLILSLLFPVVLQAGIPITFGIFAGIGAIVFVLTAILLEETKGKKLES